MKKLVFGEVEKQVPSMYCKSFNYQESDISYPVDEINFYEVANGCVLELPMRVGEHFYGMGLQLKTFDHTHKKVKLSVNADPVAPSGDTHAPVPFFVSTKGYGIYIDTARYISCYFGKRKLSDNKVILEQRISHNTDDLYRAYETQEDEVILVHIPVAKGVTIYIMEGDNITDTVSKYNMLAGGGCSAPEWSLGLLYRCYQYNTQDEVLNTAKYFRDKKMPCSILGLEPGWHTRSYSCSYVWNPERYPNPKEMVDTLYDMGYHLNLWEHAYVHPTSPIYDDMIKYGGNFEVWNGIVPDFTYDEAQEIFAKHHRDNVTFGKIDGFKIDECDDSDNTGGWGFPLCSQFPCGMDGEQYHSMFGALYMQTVLKAIEGKETLAEVRSAGALCSPYPFVLYSDLYDHKDFVRGLATAGFSGLLWTPEVRHANSKEEFLKRLQSVVFSPQCLINAWYCTEYPWINFDCESEMKYWLDVRQALVPKLKKAFDKYKVTGISPVRALVSDYSDDEDTYAIDDQYLMCDDLLVAPVFVGEPTRKVYIPQGEWKNYFTGEKIECGWHEITSENILVFQKV